MKELSVQEKAKAYDEAIKKVNDYYEGKTKLYSDIDKTLDYLFPELKESEDERIRKNLIELFHDTVSNDEIFSDYGLDKTEVLAWLEKATLPSHSDDSSFIEDIKAVIAESPQLMQSDKTKMITWLEKQGESDETKAKIFLIDKGYPIDTNGTFPTYEEMYAIIREGIEVQGEQKTVVIPKFRIGDIIKDTEDGEVFTIRTITKDKYIYTDDRFDWIKDQDEYELVEQTRGE